MITTPPGTALLRGRAAGAAASVASASSIATSRGGMRFIVEFWTLTALLATAS
jgi:hypothetical protein